MTRKKGTFEMSANVEARLAAPFDARLVVPTKADLTEAANFQYSYIGMIVSVQSEGIAYMLTADDPTALGNWKMVGEGITPTINVDDAMSETSENPVQNKVITAALNEHYTKTETDALLDGKQDELTAGDGVVLASDPYTGTTVISTTNTFVATYNVTTSQELKAYLAQAGSHAPILVKRNNDYYTAVLSAESGADSVIVRVLGSNSGDYYLFTYTVTGSTWANSGYGLQKRLESGTNIKTINGESILGEGDLDVTTDLSDYYNKAETDTLLDGKQDELTAGDNIAILSDPYTGTTVISATDTTYTAGEGLALTGTEFSADTSVMATKQDLESYYDKTETDSLLDGKQDELTAGNNITIVTDPYTNTTVISASDPDLSDYYNKGETDALLADKADKSDTYTKTETDTLLDGKQDELTAGENISIVQDPYTGTTVISTTGGGSGGTVGEDFTTNIEVGGLASGTAIDKDDTITSVLKRMLVTTYYPTYTAPSVTINYPGATLLKVGTNISAATVTEVFNAGAIMLEGVKQNDRAGAATSYTLATSGAATDFNETNTTGSFSVPALTRNTKGNIVATATVAHAAGPQPKDSDGNDYGSPLAAGSVTASKTFEFILPFYHGVANSSTISDFTGLTEDLSKKGQKQYTYSTNNQHMVIAYDSTYGNLTSILDPNNFETINSWNKSTLTVDGQNYNVYVAATPSTNPSAKYTFKF